MFILKTSLLILGLVCLIEGGVAFPSQIRSKRDQYERSEIREDGGSENKAQVERTQNKDVTVVTHIPIQEFDDSTSKRSSSEIVNNVQLRSYVDNGDNVKEDQQRKLGNDDGSSSNKRRFYPTFKNRGPHFRSRNAWKPSEYPLDRPYYIPVYGIEGSTPIYISQQPIYLNQKTTPENLERPPSNVDSSDIASELTSSLYSPEAPSGVHVNGKKKRFTNNFIDDMPVWDLNESLSVSSTVEPMTKPASSKSQDEYDIHGVEYDDYNNFSPFFPKETHSTTTQSISKDIDSPNNCVLAIVSCCSVSSSEVNINCFNQFRCFGPFWDINPCGTKFVKYAVDRATNFYNS